jgi:YNFM family putative membrane transporter
MTYSASVASSGRVRNALNVYIGTSILGGVSGRLIGGFLAEFVHWRAAFALTAVLLAAAWIGLRGLRSEAKPNASPIDITAVSRALGNPVYRYACFGIFCVFFVFASLLNYLPFRLKALDPTIGEAVISLMYLGYLIGVAIALNGVRIADWLGGELRVVFAGISVLAIGILGVSSQSLPVVYGFVFGLCAGFFLIHSALTAFLNHVTPSGRGVVNGLYISSYYAGGALGAWLPGYVYRTSGWSSYLAVLGIVLLSAGWWVRRLMAAHAAQTRP